MAMLESPDDNRHFYRDLPVDRDFEQAIDIAGHASVPADWWIVVADIVGSTAAISRGAYKDVNTVGVACIAAVLNVERSIAIPYLFGGDGATFAIPDCLRERVVVALRGAQRMAQRSFNLELRAGLIQVAALSEDDNWVRLGKCRLSDRNMQPVFSGRGWEQADRLVKTPGAPAVLRVHPEDEPAEASFEGFECRWQNVPSFADHKLSLIVVATTREGRENLAVYQAVLEKIRTLFGHLDACHPLRPNRLHLSFSPRKLAGEWRVRSQHLGFWGRLRYALKLLIQNLVGSLLFAGRIDTATVRWSRYRDDLVDNSDFRKFDGALRMVLDAHGEQSQALIDWLAQRHQAGELVYGSHTSQAALITCLVESHADQHIHFVDGSDGGYAMAARQLKQQLKMRVSAESER